MKTTFYFLIIASLLTGCSKDKVNGDIRHSVKYTTSSFALKTAGITTDSLYTQFGTYITSVTPSHFSSKINIMCYQDNWDFTDKLTHMISYVDGHDNDPRYEIATYADFSNNQEVEITPILYGTDMRDGMFEQKEVTFTYFNFCPYYLYQEVEIPIQYKDIIIHQFNEIYNERYYCDSVKFGNILKIKHVPFISRLFQYGNGYPYAYVFGNTDSTFVYNKEGNTVPNSEHWPFGGSTMNPIIRSNKYIAKTVNMPTGGETIEMASTISFDTENLIQIYAGHDNIPYTSDDIFLYAPNYWERLKVKLEVK